MTDDQRAKAGDPWCAHTADGGSPPVTPRQRRMTAQRKQDAVLRVLRGEDLELVGRDVGVTAADLNGWRDSFLEAGAASLRSRAQDGRDRTIQALHAKVGEISRQRVRHRFEHRWRRPTSCSKPRLTGSRPASLFGIGG